MEVISRSDIAPLNSVVVDGALHELGYKLAESLGFKNNCLGRGAIDIKRRMGANRVVDLENWLIPIRTINSHQMHEFSSTRES